MNIYNQDKDTSSTQQCVYDAYNSFLFNSDRNVFFKMLTRISLFEKIKDLPGDIVECGVFKGSGMVLWAKLLDLYSPHDIRKIIGFDFFDQSFVENLENEKDKEMMSTVFTRCSSLTEEDISEKGIYKKIIDCNIPKERFELVKGDISSTSIKFCEERPGFRISLLYMDLDLEEPTYEALRNLWPRVVHGGIIVFDEYAFHCWTEANAVDRFVNEHGLSLIKTNVKSPTAYIVKN